MTEEQPLVKTGPLNSEYERHYMGHGVMASRSMQTREVTKLRGMLAVLSSRCNAVQVRGFYTAWTGKNFLKGTHAEALVTMEAIEKAHEACTEVLEQLDAMAQREEQEDAAFQALKEDREDAAV